MFKTLSEFSIDDNKKLGSGYNSVVKEARHIATGKKYAVKIIDLTTLKNHERRALKKELEIQQKLQFRHITRLYSCFQKGNHLYLILEFSPNGTLHTLMHKKRL